MSPTVSDFKIPEQPPINYLLITKIGSKLLRNLPNLSSLSAGSVGLHNVRATVAVRTNR